MMCYRCRKQRATIHSIEKREGMLKDLHFCEECARKAGYIAHPEDSRPELMIERLMKDQQEEESTQKKRRSRRTRKICPRCGLTLSDLSRAPRARCPNDFEVFRMEIRERITESQGTAQHVGKTAGSSEVSVKLRTIEMLKRQLEEAVRAEDYEAAAKLRDRIRELS